MNGDASSDDEVPPIFYNQQALDENQMSNLKNERVKTLVNIKDLYAKSKEVHSQSSGLCVQREREELKKLLSDAKSKKLRKITVPESIFEPNDKKLTVVRLYGDWHATIEVLVANQAVLAENIVKKWFKFFNKLKIEDDSEEFLKVRKVAEDDDEREEYDDDNNEGASFFWLMCLFLILSVVSFIFYCNDDPRLSLFALIDYLLSELMEFYVQMYKNYLAFHSIELTNVTHEILVNT